MGTGCSVPGWGGKACSCCLLDELLVTIWGWFACDGCSVVPSALLGFSVEPDPYVSAPAFSFNGMLDSALLDSAALWSCFFTGVDWDVLPVFTGPACLTFSGGVASPVDRCSLGAKHGRQASSPPDLFLLLVDPSRCPPVGTGGAWPAFSDAAARCCERLLLAVLPARRLFKKLRLECFDPLPMLSESAAVTPLSPVPVGVCSSLGLDCEPDGTPRNDCFCFESASARPSEGGSRDEDRGGTIVFCGPTPQR